MESSPSRLTQLEKRLGASWHHINNARILAQERRERLRSSLRRIDSEDTSIVVLGSLARDEFTQGSDIDWTLLVDGFADPKHLELARRMDEIVGSESAKSPGREGTFGTLAFSHELVQYIGGEDDTNRNTTRRILLLLESNVVGRPEAYERVVTNVLRRYIFEDRGFVQQSGPYHVPRFLLNDFARYWWTMAVDFAYKQRTRFGEGAALRNIKLRMSRKLIYVSGLLTCFGCELGFGDVKPSLHSPGPGGAPESVDCLRRRLRQTPLEILAGALLHFDHLDETGRKLLDAYDGFLGVLADPDKRKSLETLEADKYESNAVFQNARGLSHRFRDGLLELFFDQKSGLFDLTKHYGVF
ncbi:MAG: nucleotidyltransferase domain-containing protein [Acidobacteria bacterium]|nr:nucleotidyltransferase domain-containing protein [Acidobacteriota bacterium]